MSNYMPERTHGHPDKEGPKLDNSDKPSTASHPPSTAPDPTTTNPHPPVSADPTTQLLSAFAPGASNASPDLERGQSSNASGPSKQSDLEALKVKIRKALRQYPDFPSPGVLFEDIMPIFASYQVHSDLIAALEMQVKQSFSQPPDVIVGLDSRGFLFGPSLALRIGAGFVPVRKQGKLPGPTETEGFEKEYGTDYFQIQSDAIKQGQTVVVVDDIIATGGSAKAAGSLVEKIGGKLLGYVFLMELDFLKGREKLNAPVHTLLSGQEEKLQSKDLPLGQTKESADQVKSVQDAGGAAAETRP